MNTLDLTNIKRLEEQLNVLENQVRNKIIYSSLVKGGKVLVDATKQTLTTKMGYSATKAVKKPNGKGYYKPLVDGVRIGGDKIYCEVNVNILGHGYLRWFDKGTNIRKTSKGYNRGSIQAINFFFSARQSSYNKMINTITENMDKQIQKIMK